jgi:hypothetical protein
MVERSTLRRSSISEAVRISAFQPSALTSHNLPHHFSPINQFFFLPPYFSLTSHMSGQSGPSHFQALFEAAFRDYEKLTGKTLANHPLAEKLQNCDSIESVTAVIREQTETSGEVRGNDKVLKPLKNVLSVLHKLSSASAVNFGQHLGLVRP